MKLGGVLVSLDLQEKIVKSVKTVSMVSLVGIVIQPKHAMIMANVLAMEIAFATKALRDLIALVNSN